MNPAQGPAGLALQRRGPRGARVRSPAGPVSWAARRRTPLPVIPCYRNREMSLLVGPLVPCGRRTGARTTVDTAAPRWGLEGSPLSPPRCLGVRAAPARLSDPESVREVRARVVACSLAGDRDVSMPRLIIIMNARSGDTTRAHAQQHKLRCFSFTEQYSRGAGQEQILSSTVTDRYSHPRDGSRCGADPTCQTAHTKSSRHSGFSHTHSPGRHGHHGRPTNSDSLKEQPHGLP